MQYRTSFVTFFIFALFSGFIFSSCTPSTMTQNQSTDTVTKSPNDSRKYKTLTLPNQLEVMLVSDPSSDQAAVSMDIWTGQINDPPSRQGLTHFLEHMLFLGTEKYPDPEEFGEFLSAHGGYANAYTAFEDTNFFFSIQNEYLEGAVDRFVQFFISPKFSAEFVEREINAVNSEHNKNIKDDRRRIYRILKETSNPEHPFHQFATGNLDSLLGENKDFKSLRQDLIRYFEENYSANRMKLVVVAKASIPQLEELVKAHFSAIENKHLPEKSYEDTPIIVKDELPRKIQIEPVKSMRQLRLSFPMPSYRQYYRSKPGSVISQLLGDEGEGSVLSYLKQKGWINTLSAGIGFRTRDFSKFGVEMTLTPDGLNHTSEIVATVFEYIELIKQSSNLQTYFSEMKKMAEIGFRFREKEDPIDYARYLAATMQEVPAEDAVVSRWLYDEYRPDLVNEILSYLNPENLQMVQVAPQMETDRKEKWYGIDYAVKEIDQEQIESWKKVEANPRLALPEPNPFIPDNVELNDSSIKEPYPVLLQDSPSLRIWYKADDTFNVPKANIQVQMATRDAYQTAKKAAMTKLFVLQLKDQLNEFTYPASLAGLNFSLSNSIQGLNINVSGYSENIYLLIERIVRGMKTFKAEPDRFDIFKNQIRERRQNQKLAQAYQRITYESYYLLSDPMWHTDDYLSVIDSIRLKEFEAFVPELLSRLKIEMLSHGNLTVEETRKIGKLFRTEFGPMADATIETTKEKTIQVPVTPDYHYQIQVEDVNSAIEYQFQVGPRSPKQSVTLDMIQQILEKPFYHQLRTIEQLGYLVWSGFRQSNNVESFYFIIQSGVQDPVYLQERIEAFIKSFTPEMQSLSDQEFEKYRKALISKREEPPKNLGEESHRYWSEISNKSYHFKRLDKEIETLKALQVKDVIDLYEKAFVNADTKRDIAIHGFGKNDPLRQGKGQSINDASKFKKTMPAYPPFETTVNVQEYAN